SRCSAGTARGIFSLAKPFGAGVGQAAGVGTATARDGGGVGFSGPTARSPALGVGVFLGFGVASSFSASFDFPVFLVLRAVSFPRDFFFADFGLGVGVGCRFDFGEAVGSGVSRGVGFDVFSPSLANFAFGIAVAVSSGVGDARCFFVDLLVALFAPGLGDFFGLGVGVARVSLRVVSSGELLC